MTPASRIQRAWSSQTGCVNAPSRATSQTSRRDPVAVLEVGLEFERPFAERLGVGQIDPLAVDVLAVARRPARRRPAGTSTASFASTTLGRCTSARSRPPAGWPSTVNSGISTSPVVTKNRPPRRASSTGCQLSSYCGIAIELQIVNVHVTVQLVRVVDLEDVDLAEHVACGRPSWPCRRAGRAARRPRRSCDRSAGIAFQAAAEPAVGSEEILIAVAVGRPARRLDPRVGRPGEAVSPP